MDGAAAEGLPEAVAVDDDGTTTEASRPRAWSFAAGALLGAVLTGVAVCLPVLLTVSGKNKTCRSGTDLGPLAELADHHIDSSSLCTSNLEGIYETYEQATGKSVEVCAVTVRGSSVATWCSTSKLSVFRLSGTTLSGDRLPAGNIVNDSLVWSHGFVGQ